MAWSLSDQKFLRSLRILADEPAPVSQRFVVEAGPIEGEYHVVDRDQRFRDHVFGKGWKQPRESAEDFARQMNAKHASIRAREEEDGA